MSSVRASLGPHHVFVDYIVPPAVWRKAFVDLMSAGSKPMVQPCSHVRIKGAGSPCGVEKAPLEGGRRPQSNVRWERPRSIGRLGSVSRLTFQLCSGLWEPLPLAYFAPVTLRVCHLLSAGADRHLSAAYRCLYFARESHRSHSPASSTSPRACARPRTAHVVHAVHADARL